MAMDERAFFTEKPESRPGRYQCPKCRRTNEYSIRWVRRAKKDRLPPGADERDRAKFAKLRDYLLRLDDEVTLQDVRQEVRNSVATLAGLRGSARRPAQR
jgi:hypothetical protein